MSTRSALLAMLCFVLVAVPASADFWVPEALPFEFAVGSGLGFALDSTGTPGFSFRTTTGVSGLYHGYNSGGNWVAELIDGSTNAGEASSLLYDGTTAHIIYGSGAGTSATDRYLNHVTGGPGSWSAPDTITNARPRHTDIGLDADGNLAAAWADTGTTAGAIYYVYQDETAWQAPEEVASNPRVLSGVALLLPGTAEEAGVLYSDESDGWTGVPTHMHRDPGGTWSAGSGAGFSGTEDLAWMSGTLNKAGNPLMAYMDMTTGNLVYAEWDGAAWSTEIVADIPWQMGFPDRSYVAIAADDWGHAHLIYYNPDTEQVEYRYRHADGHWGGARTIHQDTTASWMRLAIDDRQRPWFSYYSQVDGEGSLYYGHGSAVPEPATSALLAMGLLSLILKRRHNKTLSRGQS